MSGQSLTQTFEHSDEWWRLTAIQAVEDLAASGRPFEAYDVTELGVVDPPHANCWGGLFHTARAKGLIEVAGYAQSRRPSRSGGLCRLWIGTKKNDGAGTLAKESSGTVVTSTTNS